MMIIVMARGPMRINMFILITRAIRISNIPTGTDNRDYYHGPVADK